jgi:hypothetical protein
MRHGLTIKEAPCPRCANKRTANLGTHGSVCFNCRHRFEPPRPTANLAAFSASELARLEVYRAAVQAGFYTDEAISYQQSAVSKSDGAADA